MESFVQFQTASRVDRVTEDGVELYQRPYPMPFHLDGKAFDPSGFWTLAEVSGVVGFQKNPNIRKINVWWFELVQEYNETGDESVFEKVIGMRIVTVKPGGGMSVHDTEVETVTFYPAVAETPVADALKTLATVGVFEVGEVGETVGVFEV